MSNPLHEIDQIFRDGIESRAEYPSKDVWDNIDAALDKKIAISYKGKYKSLKRTSSILLLLLLSIITYQAAKLSMHGQGAAGNKRSAYADAPRQRTDNLSHAHQNKRPEANTQYYKLYPGNQTSLQLPATNASNNTDIRYEASHDRVVQTIAVPETVLIDESPTDRGEKEDQNNTYTSIKYPRADASRINEREQMDGLFSLSRQASDDSWKKDIVKDMQPAINSSLHKSDGPAKDLQSARAGHSRFSISFFGAAGMAWNALADDKYQPGRGRGIRDNGNGSSSTAGNVGSATSGTTGGGNNLAAQGIRGDTRSEIKESESRNSMYAAGIKLNYAITKKISLQTGINYLVNSTSIKPNLIFATKDNTGNVNYRLTCSSGYSLFKPNSGTNAGFGDSTIVNDTRSKISYLGIPLLAEYNLFSAGKFSVAVAAGAQVNILIKGGATTVFGKGTINETYVAAQMQGLQRTYFSAVAGITGEIQVNKNVALTLAPTAQFGLSYMNKGTSVKTRPNYLGLATGLKLKF